MSGKAQGKVFLVGAGPGDPGLLTLKGRDCLAAAEVVVYDFLANPAILDHAPAAAERLYVGKRGGDHTLEQDEINRLIVARAAAGRTVVRLKGGDPFIFGRGGEEAEELVKAGIPFEIVPGVTSAIAVPAYAGIPLTHRDHTASVAFVTGHENPLKETSGIHWDKLATGVGTLVFLMGVKNLPAIAANLIRHGRDPKTPAAVIERGTEPGQKTVAGPLADLAALAAKKGIRPPAVIVVGGVVGLRDTLNWFEKRPLFGKRIVVTRAREQASDFVRLLRELGAACIEFPTIAVTPPPDWDPLDRALARLGDYAWLITTSVNGVRFFMDRLLALGKDARDLAGLRLAAIGDKTADQWRRYGLAPDLVPTDFRAEGLLEALAGIDLRGRRILIPRALEAREILPAELARRGARIDVVPAYQTVMPATGRSAVAELMAAGAIDLVTFTSSSTVRNFVAMFQDTAAPALPKAWMTDLPAACIGPVTAQTAREHGFRVAVTAGRYTLEDLAGAILTFFTGNQDL